jgi:recombinational DNA repair ATPase RecF
MSAARPRAALTVPWLGEVRAWLDAVLGAAFSRHVGRALDWHHMLQTRTEWLPRVADWLRLWLERRELLRGGWPDRSG